MKYTSHFPLGIVIPLLACSVPLQAAENMTEQSTPDESAATAENHEETMVITAARQNLQAPGVSTITAEEIRKHPPARDVSELIRTQPGVNLTGNSTSGQRGNNRQIDIRGMGPENTLVLSYEASDFFVAKHLKSSASGKDWAEEAEEDPS